MQAQLPIQIFRQYMKLVLKSCSYSSHGREMFSLSTLRGVSLFTNLHVSPHSCTTDTAFSISDGFILKIKWLNKSRGQSYLVIGVPSGDTMFSISCIMQVQLPSNFFCRMSIKLHTSPTIQCNDICDRICENPACRENAQVA